LNSVINEAIACCRARLEQDSVDVSVSASTSLEIESDRSLMLQTMINIIGNAGYAMRGNDVHSRSLTIDAQVSGSNVQIRFRDNGCGMTRETLSRVFDAHFTTRENGTGLGLHFCAITLKRLGGSIRGFSQGPGQGSTFVIELPRGKPKSVSPTLTEGLPIVADVGARR
jgi:C4-dicarboxylate-specific signal transduction histidine kinase